MCLVEKLVPFSCLGGKISKKGSVRSKQACDQAVIKILPDFQKIFQLLTSPETTRRVTLLFSLSVMSDSLWPPWTAAHQASLSFTISQSLLKLMSIELVLPSSHLTVYHPILLLPSVFPSIKVFPSELAIHIRWPKHWSFNFNVSPSNEYSGLISF